MIIRAPEFRELNKVVNTGLDRRRMINFHISDILTIKIETN